MTERPRESFAEQMVEAEATLWQMNAGMSLVHGAFPTLGQVERGLDLSVRSRVVGVAPRGHPILGTHGEVPLHSLDLLPAPVGIPAFGEGREPVFSDRLMAMSATDFNGRGSRGERTRESNDFLGEGGRDLLAILNEALKGKGLAEVTENEASNVQALFARLGALISIRHGFDVVGKTRALREFLVQRIHALQLYRSFLVEQGDGTFELRPPGELVDQRLLPPFFDWSGLTEKAIPIVIGENHSPGWIYVRVGNLRIIQDVVSRERLQRYEGSIEKAIAGSHPPSVFRSLNQGDYYLDNGHHRALLVSRIYGEHLYLLTRQMAPRSTVGEGKSLKDLREVSEEEFRSLCGDEDADSYLSDIVSGGFW